MKYDPSQSAYDESMSKRAIMVFLQECDRSERIQLINTNTIFLMCCIRHNSTRYFSAHAKTVYDRAQLLH